MKTKKMVGSRKQEKERIRGPRLRIQAKSRANGNRVPFEEGLARAGEDRVIASNKRLDKALNETGEWERFRELFPCWSGTMTGYEKPGKKLGKSVVYTDPETKQRYVFPVPEDYKGAKNAILAVEHPDYTLNRDGKDLVVAVKNIENLSLVENFPTSDGWYLTDEKHGIPTGDEVNSSNDDARYLWRIEDGSRVAPVARGDGYYYVYNYDYLRRLVGLYDGPSNSLGVAVEAPEVLVKVNGAIDTPNEFKAIVDDAVSNLDNLLQTVREEKVRPLLKLLEAVKTGDDDEY